MGVGVGFQTNTDPVKIETGYDHSIPLRYRIDNEGELHPK